MPGVSKSQWEPRRPASQEPLTCARDPGLRLVAVSLSRLAPGQPSAATWICPPVRRSSALAVLHGFVLAMPRLTDKSAGPWISPPVSDQAVCRSPQATPWVTMSLVRWRCREALQPELSAPAGLCLSCPARATRARVAF